MAIKLKSGKTFTPDIANQYGIDLTNSDYEGRIESVQYDVTEKTCLFSMNIYCNHVEHQDSASIIQRFNFNFYDESFDTSIGSDGITISEAQILALESMTDWENK